MAGGGAGLCHVSDVDGEGAGDGHHQVPLATAQDLQPRDIALDQHGQEARICGTWKWRHVRKGQHCGTQTVNWVGAAACGTSRRSQPTPGGATSGWLTPGPRPAGGLASDVAPGPATGSASANGGPVSDSHLES